MKKFIFFIVVCSYCFCSCTQYVQNNKNKTPSKMANMNNDELVTSIIKMERNALEKLNNGDPSGYLEIYADDITYFDPFKEKRFDGIEKVKTFYESMQGAFNIERYEMIEPVVQIIGETAILSYNLVSYIGNVVFREKCTEIYCRQPDKQ